MLKLARQELKDARQRAMKTYDAVIQANKDYMANRITQDQWHSTIRANRDAHNKWMDALQAKRMLRLNPTT